MFLRIGVAATSLTLASAYRVKTANGAVDAETADSETGQHPVAAGVRESEIRHCALFNFQSFADVAADCDEAVNSEDAMAEAIEHYGVELSLATMSRADELSLATMNTNDTFVDMTLCGEGQPAGPCIQSLPGILWLRQFWRFEDLSGHEGVATADRVKVQIINRALNNYGIKASRLHSRCSHEVDNPAFEIMRECVVENLPAWAAGPAVGEVQSPSGEMVDLSDPELLMQTLEGWMRSMWHNEDEITGLHHSAHFFVRRRCSAVRGRMEQDRLRYEASILATGFPLWHGVTQECHDETPSSLEASGTLQRIIEEISVCAPGDGTDNSPICSEGAHPCPEGFMCDCQRRQRQGSALVAGAVMGGIAGLAVSTALPFAVAGAAGLAFAPEYAAAWAYGSLLLGGKAEVAGVGAAFGTSELSTTCGCYPVECAYNEESEQCEMTPSDTASRGSNPFATLPFTGLKCTEHQGHHWFSSGRDCGLTECDHVDTTDVGPVIDGTQFFGRVGRSADWDETGLFNCANTEGTVGTLLTRLSSLPLSDGVEGENTVEKRMELLHQYHQQ